MLAFPCPTCDYRLLAHPGKAGKSLACPRCKANVTVPDAGPGSSVFAEEAPKLHDSSSVLAGLEGAAGGSTTAAPPRRTATRHATPAPPAHKTMARARDAVAFDMPAPSKNSEDLFVQLTTALTMRMNPPPDPPADLRLSTGVWILATALGLGLWVFAVLHDTEWLKYVWAIGGLEFAIGIVWVVHRAGRRNAAKGLLALFPPVTLYRLVCLGGPDGYRPLRFVLSGLLLAALPFIALPTRTVVRNAMGWTEPTGPADRPTETPAGKLRQIIERSPNPEWIQKELAQLATRDRSTMTDAEKKELVTEFRKLLKHESSDVRTEAIRTLYVWDRESARRDVTALLQSEYRDDRATALALLKKWPTEETVKAVIDRLTSDDDRITAKETLADIGKVEPRIVEKAALDALLNPSPTDPVPAKPLLEVLELVGSQPTVDGLTRYIDGSTDPFLTDLAKQKKSAVVRRVRAQPNGK